MDILLIALVLFVAALVLIEGLLWVLSTVKTPERARIKKRLRHITRSSSTHEEPRDILRKTVYSEIRVLDTVLRRIKLMDKLNRLLYQADAGYPAGFFIILSPLLGLSVFLFVDLLGYGLYISLPLGLVGAASPFWYLHRKKRKRMEKFISQLPEALDMMARSLKAGHAFSSSLKLIADEFGDPLGPEFEVALDEMNFGVALPDALRKMGQRVDCQDLNFFVVAVILQRETGGNLAQIIENIARLIRERFRLLDKVKSLAAEGVLSMWVLMALPFAVLGVLTLINPDYTSLLFEETVGRIMVGFALAMMFIGYFFMKSIVKIKV